MKPLPLLLGAIVTASAGFLAGRLSTSSPDTSSATTGSPSPTSSSRTARSGIPANDLDAILRDAPTGKPNPALASALKGALGNTLESKRIDRWMKLISVMRAEDAPAIAALLQEQQMAGREFKTETMAFWQTWARLDPTAAWAYAQERPDAGRHGVEALLKSWAFEDSAAASAAFKALGDSPLQDGALAGLAHGLAESNPDAAVAFVTGLDPEMQRAAGIHISGSIIYAMENEGAMTWLDSLPPEAASLQKEAARVILESLSRSDPGSVEKFALDRLDQAWMAKPDEQNFCVASILRNGGSPWEYVIAFSEKTQDPAALDRLATRAALHSPASASTWIAANPDHPAADQIRASAVTGLLNQGDRDAAQAMLSQIKDPALKERMSSMQVPGG